MVLTQIQEFKHIGMPGLQVNGKSPFSFTPALVNITGGIIEYPQHGNDTIAGSIGASNIGTGCTDIVNSQPNSTCTLGDLCGLFQRIINTINAIIFHGQQKTTGELWLGRACIKQCRRRMCEPALTHQVIGFDRLLQVIFMNTDCYAHVQMLRTFCNLSIDAQQVRFLQGFESEIIKTEITIVDNSAVQQLGIGFNYLHYLIRNQWHVFACCCIDVLMQGAHGIAEGFLCILMQVTHRNPGGQQGIIRVTGSKTRSSFSSKVIQLSSGYAIIDTFNGFFRDIVHIYQRTQSIGEFLNAGSDLIEFYGFFTAVSFYNKHG